jgi:hypothetical protein
LAPSTPRANDRFGVLSVTLGSFILFNVLQLLGVGLVAIQGGLGEASALGLCSLYPNQLSLTAWSSGTGFAGERGMAMRIAGQRHYFKCLE